MPDYHIIDANQVQRGPFSRERICQRIREGRSDAQTKVRADGGNEWVTLGELAEFAEAWSPSEPPPPAPAAATVLPAGRQSGNPKNSKQCPVCGSLRSIKASDRHKATGLQAFANRNCVVCNTTWRPACPSWAAIFFLVAGLVLPGTVILCDVMWARHFHDLQINMPAPVTPAAAPWDFSTKPMTPTVVEGDLAYLRWVLWTFVIVFGAVAVGYATRVLRGRAGHLEILEQGRPLNPPQV